jgi:hypothetical protein
MADAQKTLVWPNGAWKTLKRIIRAWYTVEESGGELTQKAIAGIAKVQPSRLSVNKPFLQAIGIVQAEGITLTDEGKQLGLGLANDNERVAKQALQSIVKANPILRQLLDVIRGRGPTDKGDFEAQVVLITKQGRQTDYFGTGVGVLEEILLESGLVAMVDNSLRPTTNTEVKEEPKDGPGLNANKVPRLRQIPIAVSASKIWFIQIDENPDEAEIVRFIEMQKLIFSLK